MIVPSESIRGACGGCGDAARLWMKKQIRARRRWLFFLNREVVISHLLEFSRIDQAEQLHFVVSRGQKLGRQIDNDSLAGIRGPCSQHVRGPDEASCCGTQRGAVASVIAHRFEVELRSEEHTSELQSQSNLVCRLLLEK